jgi:hypothetical protein
MVEESASERISSAIDIRFPDKGALAGSMLHRNECSCFWSRQTGDAALCSGESNGLRSG